MKAQFDNQFQVAFSLMGQKQENKKEFEQELETKV